jgi:hypothetical protein
MTETEENRTTRRETYLSATFSTENFTGNGLKSNPGLRGDRPASNASSHGTAVKVKIGLNYIQIFKSYLTHDRLCRLYKAKSVHV